MSIKESIVCFLQVSMTSVGIRALTYPGLMANWRDSNHQGCGQFGRGAFFQIYYRTDRDQFFHNWHRCTPPRVGFPTYSGAVFCGWFSQFEILKKKKLFFLIIKKLGFQAQYQYINLFKISSEYKLFFYLASHQKSCHT